MIATSGRYILGLAVVSFLGGLAGTVALRSQSTATEPASSGPAATDVPLAQWLELTPDEAKAVQEHDPGFAAELARLRQDLDEARARLATMFENAQAADQQLKSQVEAVIEAHNRLERRVADHLISVRHHLTPAQQKKLLELCAEGVRQCGQQRWRHGAGGTGPCWREQAESGGRGPGAGRGPGSGLGPGSGFGGGQGRGPAWARPRATQPPGGN